MWQTLIHYGLHFVFPIGIALVFYRKNWKIAYLVLLATMIVDVDHIFANPIFDPNRCSIGYHYFHSYWAIAVYVLLLLPKKTRIPSIGLLLHMVTDGIDCLFRL